MRICHTSDTHSVFFPLYGKYDIILHTGDLLPNSNNIFSGNKTKEAEFQLNWVSDNMVKFKQWVGNKPFLFTLGNHDFCSADMLEKLFIDNQIDAVSLENKAVMHEGVMFYGFPYVPTIDGSWNYERGIPEMQAEVNKMVEVLNNKYIDIIAAHSAIYSCLDLTNHNELMGSSVIATALDYQINKDMMPMIYCHGHCHESNGLTMRNGMLVSNAATTYRILEI